MLREKDAFSLKKDFLVSKIQLVNLLLGAWNFLITELRKKFKLYPKHFLHSIVTCKWCELLFPKKKLSAKRRTSLTDRYFFWKSLSDWWADNLTEEDKKGRVFCFTRRSSCCWSLCWSHRRKISLTWLCPTRELFSYYSCSIVPSLTQLCSREANLCLFTRKAADSGWMQKEERVGRTKRMKTCSCNTIDVFPHSTIQFSTCVCSKVMLLNS